MEYIISNSSDDLLMATKNK